MSEHVHMEVAGGPGTWDAACSCGALMRDSSKRTAAAALAIHIESGQMDWMERETLRRINQARAEGWDEGYLRGTLDATGDLEPADNPYRVVQ